MSKLLTLVYSAFMNFDPASKKMVVSEVTNEDEKRKHCLRRATGVYRLLCAPEQIVKFGLAAYEGVQIAVLSDTDIHHSVVTKLLNEAFEGEAEITFVMESGNEIGSFKFVPGSVLYVHEVVGRSYSRCKKALMGDPALRVSPSWFEPYVPMRCPVGMPTEHNARHAMARN